MASSTTEIANLALSHLGIGREIGNLDTENSEEANACRRFYTQALDVVLRDFQWPFATKYADLALVEETPNTEWRYSYRYPSDCLVVRKILSGLRTDNRNSRVPYEIAQDDDGLLIYSDEAEATLKYSFRANTVLRFPPDFVMAFSYRLAHYIAARVTGGDPYKLGDKAMQLYEAEMSKAMSSAANEEQPEMNVESEMIRAREEVFGDPFATRFNPA